MVKLTSMQDEYAYLLTEDYIALISRIIAEQEVWSVTLACYPSSIRRGSFGFKSRHDNVLRTCACPGAVCRTHGL